MKRKAAWLASMIVAGIIYVGFAGWLSFYSPDTNLISPSVLRVGYAVEPPYAYINEAGEATGQSPELVKLVAAELGIERVEWVLLPFSELIRELQDGHIDLIGISMFVTEERKAQVAFLEANAFVKPAILMRSDQAVVSHEGYTSIHEISGSVAALEGAVEVQWISEAFGSSARVLRVPDVFDGLNSVLEGNVTALALSEPSVRWLVEHHKGLKWLPLREHGVNAFRGMPSSLATRQGEGDFICRWNRAQAKVLQGEAYKAILSQTGFEDVTDPRRNGGG